MRIFLTVALTVTVLFFGVAYLSHLQKNLPKKEKNVGTTPKKTLQQKELDITPPTPTPLPRTIPESELIQAINTFRQAHRLSTLSTNEGLCTEARKRVQDLIELMKQNGEVVLNHDGFRQDVESGRVTELSGKEEFGENIASAICLRPSDETVVNVQTGIQLVEWCFSSSQSHRETLLRAEWTDTCSSGQFPIYVQLFAR